MEGHNLHSQQSQQSIDSSNLFSLDSSFQSTQSIKSVDQKLNENKNQQEDSPQKYLSPMEIPRFQYEKRESDLFPSFQQPFIGFVGLGKGKPPIQINESKLKKAKQFLSFEQMPSPIQMENKTEDKNDEDCDSQSTQSISDLKPKDQTVKSHQEQFSNFPQFLCGFKSMGTGKVVEVSEQASNRAKLFFGQFDQSVIKQTKSKLSAHEKRESEKLNNFIKTEKVKPTNPKQSKIIKVEKKTATNEGKKFIDGMTTKLGEKYKKIKLCDMPRVSHEETLKFAQYWLQFKYEYVEHNQQNCTTSWCYFCQKYGNQAIKITKQFIEMQVLSLLPLQQPTKNRIPQLIQLIIFKLARINFHDPFIKNKQLSPSNILLEIYKKCLFYEKQKRGPLQCSIESVVNSRGRHLGKQINLVVLSISFNEEMEIYFIELSDGWTNVFAVISSTNALTPYINKKIVVGSKLEIVNWNIYPIGNIISYHPNPNIAKSRFFCIEFNYNNSLPSPYFCKLEWPKQPFYRSVELSKEGSAGSIPLVEGIVIRMFTIKSFKNISTNYVEIMLKEGSCILMKIALAEQISLIQLFRLYYCYHFLRIKKLSKSLLEFTPNSKFYEVEDPDRLQKVKQILKNRLLNLNINKTIVPVAKQNKKSYVDLVTKSDELMIENTKVKIDEKIEGLVLLQQYSFSHLPEGLTICKGDRGSYLRRIPKIYESLQYNIL